MAARTATVTPTKGREKGAEHHVLVLPLRVNARERTIIEKRVRATMKLANAVLGDLVGRVTALKRDPDYRAALALPPGRKRNREFKRLRERHRIPAGKADAVQVAMEHWRSSSTKTKREWPADATGYPQGWMTDVIAGRVAVALGPQVWTGVREWMLGRRGKPRFKSTRRLDRAVWNSDNKSGLTFDSETGLVQWNHPNGEKHPQTLRLRPKLKPDQQQWLKRLSDRKVVSVGIKLDGPFVFLLLRVEGVPYRDSAYLDLVRASADRVVGIDPAPTHPAISTQEETLTLDLISGDELAAARERAEWIAGQQRKQDASDRAMNPDAFHADGTPLRGKKRRHSKTWQRRRARINRVQRQARMERKRTTTKLVREVTTSGARVVIERNSVKSWQARGAVKLGARVALTRPGQFRAALERETGLLAQHGVPTSYRELPTRQFPLTQQCLCGERTLRTLSERVVTCPACGLGPLDRDKFSALKARLVGETGVATLDGVALNITDFRAQAIGHCAIGKPAADAAAGEDGDRTRDACGVSCQTEPSGSTSTGQPVQLAQTVSDLAARSGGRAHRRVSEKRGNTRTHTEPATRAGRARTPREATRHGRPTSDTTPRWEGP